MRWSSSFPTIIAFAQQKGGSAPSSSCPWLPDRCPFRRIYQPLLALRPAEWLASRPGPPPSRWQRLLRPSFLPRRSPHGEVGYHYAAVWTLAAAGLAPAGTVLLWAATSLPRLSPASSLLRGTLPPCPASVHPLSEGLLPGGVPLASGRQVPTFRRRAGVRLTPPSCRTPPRSSAGPRLGSSRANHESRFRCRRDAFRHVISGSLAFVFLTHT